MHAYTNGIDTIWGETVEEAIAAYCAELGILESVDDFEPSTFRQLDDDQRLTVHGIDGAGDSQTKTVREWIDQMQSEPKPHRLICSKDW